MGNSEDKGREGVGNIHLRGIFPINQSINDYFKPDTPKWVKEEILKGNDDSALSVYLREELV